MERMCYVRLLLTRMVFFGEIHVFLHLSWIGLFESNRAYFLVKHLSCRKYSLQKLSQFSQRNNVLDSTASNIEGFISRYPCNSSTSFGANRAFSTLKTMICRKYFFQKLAQFSQENNELHASASKTNGFFSRTTCVSSTQLNTPAWNKMSLSPAWKLWFAGNIPFKL
jgi:hypothetical protein